MKFPSKYTENLQYFKKLARKEKCLKKEKNDKIIWLDKRKLAKIVGHLAINLFTFCRLFIINKVTYKSDTQLKSTIFLFLPHHPC